MTDLAKGNVFIKESSVNKGIILSGLCEFQAAIHFLAMPESRSPAAAIAGTTSAASTMTPVKTRFQFILIPVRT